MKLGFCTLLSLLLVLFKLIGELEISWLWALSPVWIAVCIKLLILSMLGGIAFSISTINRGKYKTVKAKKK